MTQDEALLLRYETLVARRAAQPETVRSMPADQRREYMRAAKARSRARQKEAAAAGHTAPTAAAVRDTLADAALMILATNGPGAAQVMNVLSSAFPGRPGLPMTVAQRARSGSLKPKLVGRTSF